MNEGRCGNERPRWLVPSASNGGPALREYSQMVISEEARKGMERLDQLRDLSREVDMLRSQISELQGEIEQEKETVQRLEGELVEEKEKARSPEEIMRSDLKELIQSGFVAGHTLSQILSEVRHYFMNKAGTEDLSEGDLEAEEV